MHQWRASTPWDQAKIRLSAHIAGTGGNLVYTHFSAARLHGLDVWNAPDQIHVNAPYNSSLQKGAPDVTVHHMDLDPRDVMQMHIQGVGTVLVTSLARTVLDCARTARFDLAAVIGDSALHKGLAPGALQAMAAELAGRRGMKRAQKVLAVLNALAESAGETRTRLIVLDLPIEQPELQIRLLIDGREYRPDFAWRVIKLILEFDGDVKYFGSASADEALVRERERENALIEDGWRIIRIKWKHLEQPEVVKVRILAAYQNAVLLHSAIRAAAATAG